jgi:hypothetical protein
VVVLQITTKVMHIITVAIQITKVATAPSPPIPHVLGGGRGGKGEVGARGVGGKVAWGVRLLPLW